MQSFLVPMFDSRHSTNTVPLFPHLSRFYNRFYLIFNKLIGKILLMMNLKGVYNENVLGNGLIISADER